MVGVAERMLDSAENKIRDLTICVGNFVYFLPDVAAGISVGVAITWAATVSSISLFMELLAPMLN